MGDEAGDVRIAARPKVVLTRMHGRGGILTAVASVSPRRG